MERQRLFDLTVRKLGRIVEAGDEFDMLEAAAALRKLLLDESPLLHQVNRQRRRRVLFRVERPTELQKLILEDEPTVYFLMEGISPRLTITASAGTEALKLDQFLARTVAWLQGQEVPVKEVILQLAHVEGGVHAGSPKTTLEATLHETNTTLSVGGIGSVARTMRGIADVVATSLQPLTLHSTE
ncbi:hypothetical protein [Aeromicrobium sp.]|uniref:hypothetical protein n=1 Tax=Aeromicrobium sp. TaxID=1871063 RepID=UPI002FC7A131